MPSVDINFWAVIVGAASNMVLGAIWYSMGVFGRQWMGLIGKSEADLKGGASAGYAIAAVAALVEAYILAHFVDYTGATTWQTGAETGFWVWLGFVATTFLTNHIFAGSPRNLYLINVGYHLVSLLIMGAILATWH